MLVSVIAVSSSDEGFYTDCLLRNVTNFVCRMSLGLGGPMITDDNVLVGVANWVIPCGFGHPGERSR